MFTIVVFSAVTGLVLILGHMTCAALRSLAYRRKAERRIAALREAM